MVKPVFDQVVARSSPGCGPDVTRVWAVCGQGMTKRVVRVVRVWLGWVHSVTRMELRCDEDVS